jgi:glyoxylase-like metal-dependent hydrolase (beta-lactamase superfamily II)
MLIAGFSAGPWSTNCWVVSPGANHECVIIDSGYESTDQIAQIVSENHLKPVAVLLTHGHIDHMWSVTPVANGYEIPSLIHSSDRPYLADPISTLDKDSQSMVKALGGNFTEPQLVTEFSNNLNLQIAGLEIEILCAPGHTQGSVMYKFKDADQPILFSGDVLFQGSIGRTDLPGGDWNAMQETLRNVVMPLNNDLLVLSGHGAQTTIGEEKMNNAYLQPFVGSQKV